MRHRVKSLAFFICALPVMGRAADLVSVYTMARNADPQFANAEATLQTREEGVVQARAALLPQINASGTLTRTHLSMDSLPGRSTRNSRDLSIQGRQTLFDWSQFSNLRAQREVRTAADWTYDAAKQDLIVRTSSAYFAVLTAVESLAAAQANQDAAKAQFDFAQKRLTVGLAPITDVYEAKASYEQARADTITAKSRLQDAYQAMIEITGQAVGQIKGLPENFRGEIPSEYNNIDDVLRLADANNPTLLAQEKQYEAAAVNVDAAYAGHYPTLQLNGSVGKSATWGDSTAVNAGTAATGGPAVRTDSIGLTLSVPIFSGGATQSQVRQAVAQREIQEELYIQNKRSVERTARNIYQTLVAGVAEVDARSQAVASAKSALDASEVGLKVGTRTLLNVLQNQNTLLTAQQAYAQARYNFLQNRLLLAQVVGKLSIDDLENMNRLLTADTFSQIKDFSLPEQ